MLMAVTKGVEEFYMAPEEPMSRDMLRLFKAVVTGLRDIAKLCASNHRLHCIDAPAFTTTFLRSRGFGEYVIRRIWRAAHDRSVMGGQVIYRYEGMVFRLRPRIEHGTAFHDARTMTPLDRFDCAMLGNECYEVPHCNSFYIYVEGELGHASIRMNVSYLVGLLARTRSGFLSKFLEFANRIIERPRDEFEAIAILIDEVLSVLKDEDKLLGFILPFVPRNVDELLHVSPLAKKLYIELVGRGIKTLY